MVSVYDEKTEMEEENEKDEENDLLSPVKTEKKKSTNENDAELDFCIVKQSKKINKVVASIHPLKNNEKMKSLNKTIKNNKTMQTADIVCHGVNAALQVVDTYDREPTANANGPMAGLYTYATAGEKGSNLPKAGAGLKATVGEARVALFVMEASAEGPNAGLHANASTTLSAGAMATARLGTAQVNVAGIGVEVKGPNVDTGVEIGLTNVEASVLGFGASVGTSGIGISTPLGGVKACAIM